MTTFILTTNSEILGLTNGDTVILPSLASVEEGKHIYIQVTSGTITLDATGNEEINYTVSSLTLTTGNYLAIAQHGTSWHVLQGIGLTQGGTPEPGTVGNLLMSNGTNWICYPSPFPTIEPVTVDDESALMPNSRQLVDGTNTAVDIATPGEIKINFTGGTSYTPSLFTTSASGEVPASGGSASDFLCADGTWKTPPGGSSFTPNLFSTLVSGEVPASGGGTTNFLRADGSWEVPAGGGISTLVTDVSGSVGGVLYWSEPFDAASYKEVVINFVSFNDAGGDITFTTPFTYTPCIVANSTGVVIPALTASKVTLPVMNTSGTLIISGF